jgi:hypothetical protein
VVVRARRTDPAAVTVSVEDNGPGMNDEVRRHCMEPFYTTKTRVLSTGLGLSLVHGIVQNAGGRVEIQSEPGRGTRVELILPVSQTECQTPPAPLPARVSVGDARVRSMVETLLGAMGYHVLREGESDDASEMLWVVEAGGRKRVEEVRTFLGGGPGRRTVVLNEQNPARWSGLRAEVVRRGARPTEIVRAVQEQAVRRERRVGSCPPGATAPARAPE